jgi:hypothetical protein
LSVVHYDRLRYNAHKTRTMGSLVSQGSAVRTIKYLMGIIKMKKIASILAGFLLATALTASGIASAALSEQEASEICVNAYLYFYPLVTMDVTRRQMTNIESGKKPGYGPMNEFAHVREYPPADMKIVVRPNFDTLYSVAWLDLVKEPIILSVPDTDGSYRVRS